MPKRRLEDMTLREKFTGAERMCRELVDHLERGFAPRAKSLVKLVRPEKDGTEIDMDVEDVTVRNHAALVVESDDFARALYEKLGEYLAAIEESVGKLANGE